MENNLNELNSLQNFANIFCNIVVKTAWVADKRKTKQKYFLVFMPLAPSSMRGLTISPELDYNGLNHFMLGLNAAMDHSSAIKKTFNQ